MARFYDGRIYLSNNAAERSLRGIAIDPSAHIGQEVEIQYRWHALHGRRVRRQYVERRAGGEIVHVELAPGMIIVVPAWMLDSAACA